MGDKAVQGAANDRITLAQSELDNGASVAALRRFNVALESLTAENWGNTFPSHRCGVDSLLIEWFSDF